MYKPYNSTVYAAELGLEARASGIGSAAGTPRSSRRSQQQEIAGISNLEAEVTKLHNVIAEMAEREERLLRMLQLPDAKPVITRDTDLVTGALSHLQSAGTSSNQERQLCPQK